MTRIDASLPDDLVAGIDRASRELNRSREEILGLAVEAYLEDLEDTTLSAQRLADPEDPLIGWGEARRALLDQD